MKSVILILLIGTFVNSFQQTFTLNIEITELKNSNGKVLLELLDENKETLQGASGEIVDNKSVITIENLSPGKYAFRYFHDENDNQKLDTNLIKMPKEGFGFSNDAKGKFGPPPFKKTIFELTKDTQMSGTPIYMKE